MASWRARTPAPGLGLNAGIVYTAASRLLPLLFFVLAIDACGGEPTAPTEVQLVGQFYGLLSIDNRSLPTVYYLSPDGEFEVSANRGSLFFESDSLVKWSTDRLITWYGPPPHTEDQGGHEGTRYRRNRTRLSIARSATVWDQGTIDGEEIVMRFTHEGIPLGAWRFRRQ